MSTTVPDHGSIVIYGGTSGVAQALLERLASRGDRVFLVGRDAERLSSIAQRYGCDWAIAEAADTAALHAAAAKARESLGTLTGIVNCMGSVLLKPAHLTSAEEWSETLTVNLSSSFALVQAAAQHLKSQGGSVLFFATAAAQIGIPSHEAIAAAKAGVIGLARSAAATYASRNIRFNVIAPGLVQTEMTRSVWDNELNAKASRGMHALGRLGQPEDIAACAQWLLDPHNQWVTGQVIGVDGGLSRVLPRQRG